MQSMRTFILYVRTGVATKEWNREEGRQNLRKSKRMKNEELTNAVVFCILSSFSCFLLSFFCCIFEELKEKREESIAQPKADDIPVINHLAPITLMKKSFFVLHAPLVPQINQSSTMTVLGLCLNSQAILAPLVNCQGRPSLTLTHSVWSKCRWRYEIQVLGLGQPVWSLTPRAVYSLLVPEPRVWNLCFRIVSKAAQSWGRVPHHGSTVVLEFNLSCTALELSPSEFI